ncbi:MAG: hypothetical protein ACK4E8_01920 [Lacibacter sp.]
MHTLHRLQTAWLQLLMLVLVLLVNTLALTLPLNVYTPGAISALFPNLFVPAGFTFSIWSVIYLLLIGYVMRSFMLLGARQPAVKAILVQRVQKTASFFMATCLLNAAWLLAWHYLQIGLSLCIMVLLLLTLLALYVRVLQHNASLTGFDRLLLHTSFVVYLGWISVATIANTTAFLVHLQWNGWGMDPAYWSTLLLVVAFSLVVFMSYFRHEMAFVAVVAWAAFGIYKAQFENAALVGYTAIAVSVASLLLSAYTWWKRQAHTPLNGVI